MLEYINFIHYLFSFLDIDEKEIWDDFVKMIADNVENNSLSAFSIGMVLLSSASPREFRDESRDSKFLHLDQVSF